MKKIMGYLVYFMCFLGIAGAIYSLALTVPPRPGNRWYVIYCIASVLLALVISGTLIAACVLLDRKQKE